MNYLLMVVGICLLGGCASSQEDRDFYYSGWLRPEEGSNMRIYGTKKAPAEYGGNASQPTDDFHNQPPMQ